jgi:hypothetical protein
LKAVKAVRSSVDTILESERLATGKSWFEAVAAGVRRSGIARGGREALAETKRREER